MNDLDKILGELKGKGYSLKYWQYSDFSRSQTEDRPVNPKKIENLEMLPELDSGVLVFPQTISTRFIHPEPKTEFQKSVEGRFSEKGYSFYLTLRPYEKKVLTGKSGDVLNSEDYQDFQDIFGKYGWKIKNRSMEIKG